MRLSLSVVTACATAVLLAAALACGDSEATPAAAPTPPPEPTTSSGAATPANTPSLTSTHEPEGTNELTSGTLLKPVETPGPTSLTSSPPPVFAVVFDDPPERDLYKLAAELKPDIDGDIPRAAHSDPVSYLAGREDTFWLVDLPALEVYSSLFELRLVTTHAYWYFESGQSVDQETIEEAAREFEERVYPRVTAVFGKEWSPGIDNDPHISIINASLSGVGGYFSSMDEYPVSVSQFSNQREAIYINTGAYAVESPLYLEVLAHELQHAVHWNADPSEDTWVNEGLSELAVTVAGFGQGSIHHFLQAEPTSLVHWPVAPVGALHNYGASSLFMHYLVEHYGDRGDLRPLLKESGDGIAGITNYLKSTGHDLAFRDVFRDWAAANLLDEETGPFSYSDLEVGARIDQTVRDYSEFTSEVPQYAVEYVELKSFRGPLRLGFQGMAKNDLLQTEVDSRGCWWSNSGDSINSTLTRELDLEGLSRATLRYQVWYDVEESWDYAYLEVSEDGGRRWDILSTPNTTSKNPIGNSFGDGYSGASGGWLDESVDLSAYTGKKVKVRFQYVTDDAVNGPGMCVRGVSLPEAGLYDLDEGWDADGFLLTNNQVSQGYIVQVIQMSEENRVRTVPLDEMNRGELLVQSPESLERLVVAVAALAPKTRQPAQYTLLVEPG